MIKKSVGGDEQKRVTVLKAIVYLHYIWQVLVKMWSSEFTARTVSQMPLGFYEIVYKAAICI